VNNFENIIQYPDLGHVRFVRNREAKNLTIRISRTGEVRVTVPGYTSLHRAEGFVRSKKEWINRKLKEIHRQVSPVRTIREGDHLVVRDRSIPVYLRNEKDSIEDAIWRILLEEAKDYLPGRVKELAGQYGFRISGVKIRRMTSRWGSCTTRNNINLNSWLVMLPDHLTDYVILHELVHTRHRDHSPAFWEALDKLTDGRSRVLRKELKEEKIMLVHTV
jgi:predicted metal-dependent hydrolase